MWTIFLLKLTIIWQRYNKKSKGLFLWNTVYITSYFQPEVLLIAKIGKKQRRTAKISTSYRKPILLNPFLVTNLRSAVEWMHWMHNIARAQALSSCLKHITLNRLRVRLNVILFIVCPMQCMTLNWYKITWVYVCLSVCLSVCPKYSSSTIATAVFVRSSSNLEC